MNKISPSQNIAYSKLQSTTTLRNLSKTIERCTGRKLAFERKNTLLNLLHNDKDNTPFINQPGVYKIPLRNLDLNKDEAYIGYTSRNLKTRIKEHKQSLCYHNTTTALTKRFLEYNLDIDWSNTTLLKCIPNKYEGCMYEAIEVEGRQCGSAAVSGGDPALMPSAWGWLVRGGPRS